MVIAEEDKLGFRVVGHREMTVIFTIGMTEEGELTHWFTSSDPDLIMAEGPYVPAT